jgi:hypothetical protein
MLQSRIVLGQKAVEPEIILDLGDIAQPRGLSTGMCCEVGVDEKETMVCELQAYAAEDCQPCDDAYQDEVRLTSPLCSLHDPQLDRQ